MLYKIHKRLQEITGNNLPFGGKNILVLGDFFQIVPVGDSCLYKDIIKYVVLNNDNGKKSIKCQNKNNVNELAIIGAKLFTKFKLLTLNDQVRAAEDELQMKSLLLLRSFSGNQVSNNLLQTLIQNNTLNKKDFEECNKIGRAHV